MYLKTYNKSECYGCTACEQSCSHHAITMTPDRDGFYYPVVDLNCCEHCGLCEKVCPFDSNTDLNPQPPVFAAYAKSSSERKGSSSGALFYIIAKAVIEEGGIVFGATIDENCQVYHQSSESLEDLQRLRGSKYVQSKLSDTYRAIRTYLKNGRKVYFVGTGCQVAGLRSFLIKEYDNLLTSDLVCHGVPSQKLFDEHIHFLEKKHHGKISKYYFRDNSSWQVLETILLKTEDSNIHHIRSSYELSPYLYSFMEAMTYRDSCYECKFARIPRSGDITLADFWGAPKFYPQIDSSNGISLVLLNSNIGTWWFRRIKEQICFLESTQDIAALQNRNLVKSTHRPNVRNYIFDEIQKYGYEYVAKTIFRPKNYFLKKIISNGIEIIGRKNYQKFRSLFK